MRETTEKTLNIIEEVQKTWYYELTNEQSIKHSYGRVPEDKNRLEAWSIPRSTGDFLFGFAKLLHAKEVLELGTSLGYSTLFLADAVLEFGGKVSTIDIFKPKLDIAIKHAKFANLPNIQFIKSEIKQFLPTQRDAKYDLIFMDADKESYVEYFEQLLRIVKPNGIIIADNTRNYRNLMLPFIELVLKDSRINLLDLPYDNGLLVIQKKL